MSSFSSTSWRSSTAASSLAAKLLDESAIAKALEKPEPGKWRSSLTYFPKVESKIFPPIEFRESDLLGDFKDALDSEWAEKVETISIYRHKIGVKDWWLKAFSSTLGFFKHGDVNYDERFLFHAIVVFKTKGWWYSAEKLDEGVIVQVGLRKYRGIC